MASQLLGERLNGTPLWEYSLNKYITGLSLDLSVRFTALVFFFPYSISFWYVHDPLVVDAACWLPGGDHGAPPHRRPAGAEIHPSTSLQELAVRWVQQWTQDPEGGCAQRLRSDTVVEKCFYYVNPRIAILHSSMCVCLHSTAYQGKTSISTVGTSTSAYRLSLATMSRSNTGTGTVWEQESQPSRQPSQDTLSRTDEDDEESQSQSNYLFDICSK